MNFDQALFEYNLHEKEDMKAAANIIINFDNGRADKGYTTLKAPRYYRDKAGTMATVKKAWEYVCGSDESKLYSITSIEVIYEGSDNGEKENSKRITA